MTAPVVATTPSRVIKVLKPEKAPQVTAETSKTSKAIPLPPIRNGVWLRTEPNALPQELIAGMLHKGCKMVLGAGSKARKTWALIDMTLSVSTGQPWMGLATTAGPVLFVNFEVQEPFFVDRLRSVAKARGIEVPDRFHSWNLRGHATSAETLLPRLAEQMQAIQPVLVVLDPTYKLMGGTPENDAGAVTELCNSIERLAVSTSAAVVFAAHFSKGNQSSRDAMDRISGSGVFARDPDAILVMTKHSADGCLTIESILRNCPELPPFVVEWQHPLLVRREDLDPADLKQAPMPGKKPDPFTTDDIIAVLVVGETIKPTAWQKRAKETIGISPSRFWDILRDLRVKGSPRIKDHHSDGLTRLI